MSDFCVRHSDTATTFDSVSKLLTHLGPLLGTGEPLTIFLPKFASEAVHGILAMLEQNRIKVILTADSAPAAQVYLAQTLLGGVVGGTSGTLGRVWTLAILSRIGYLIPGVGWFLTVTTFLGIVAGAITGCAVTHMGLRIRFVQTDAVQVDLEPLGA